MKHTAVLLGFAILGTVEICEVHCSFVGVDSSRYIDSRINLFESKFAKFEIASLNLM